MATFAERLKELRDERHISQKALGEEIGLSENTIYRWESATQAPFVRSKRNVKVHGRADCH